MRNLDRGLFSDGMAVLVYDVVFRQLCIAIDLAPVAAWQYGVALIAVAVVIGVSKRLTNAAGRS